MTDFIADEADEVEFLAPMGTVHRINVAEPRPARRPTARHDLLLPSQEEADDGDTNPSVLGLSEPARLSLAQLTPVSTASASVLAPISSNGYASCNHRHLLAGDLRLARFGFPARRQRGLAWAGKSGSCRPRPRCGFSPVAMRLLVQRPLSGRRRASGGRAATNHQIEYDCLPGRNGDPARYRRYPRVGCVFQRDMGHFHGRCPSGTGIIPPVMFRWPLVGLSDRRDQLRPRCR